MAEKIAAKLSISDAGRMTPAGRKDIAKWLRKQAKSLLEEGDQYARRFSASYRYDDGVAREEG